MTMSTTGHNPAPPTVWRRRLWLPAPAHSSIMFSLVSELNKNFPWHLYLAAQTEITVNTMSTQVTEDQKLPVTPIPGLYEHMQPNYYFPHSVLYLVWDWPLLMTSGPWWVSSGIGVWDAVFQRSWPELLLAKRLDKAIIFRKIKTITKLHPQLCPCSIYPFLLKFF